MILLHVATSVSAGLPGCDYCVEGRCDPRSPPARFYTLIALAPAFDFQESAVGEMAMAILSLPLPLKGRTMCGCRPMVVIVFARQAYGRSSTHRSRKVGLHEFRSGGHTLSIPGRP